jgi:hypothetical protein
MPTKRTGMQPPSPPSFQFVNANPQSDLEKINLQKLVRTNATNKYWRQRKKASALTRSLSHSTQSIAPISKPDRIIVYDGPSYRGVSAPTSRAGTSLAPNGEPRHASNTPMSLLGIGQVDPFGVYPSELPMHVVSPALAQRQLPRIHSHWFAP